MRSKRGNPGDGMAAHRSHHQARADLRVVAQLQKLSYNDCCTRREPQTWYKRMTVSTAWVPLKRDSLLSEKSDFPVHARTAHALTAAAAADYLRRGQSNNAIPSLNTSPLADWRWAVAPLPPNYTKMIETIILTPWIDIAILLMSTTATWQRCRGVCHCGWWWGCGRRRRWIRKLSLEHEEALGNAAHDQVTAREEGVNTPGACELGLVALRLGVEVGHLIHCVVRLNLQDAQACTVVRLVDVVTRDVVVVVNGCNRMPEFGIHHRVCQICHIEDIGLRVLVSGILLVQLVVHIGERMVVVEPALMRVVAAIVWCSGNQHWLSPPTTCCPAHINDRHGVLIVRETDLLASMSGVRTAVNNALGIVRVAIGAETTPRKIC